MAGRRLVAVIDIGSTAIRMVVAQIDTEGNWSIVDRAGKPVGLGRDVFVSGTISRDTMSQALQILRGFRELIEGWQIGNEDIRVVATAALREAHNRDMFVDRVALQTGIQINIVEGIEENRLTYMAVQESLKDLRPQIARFNSIIIEVGGGSTEVMLLQRGKMAAAHSLHIGTVRIEQQVRSLGESDAYLAPFLRESINTVREVLGTEMRFDRIRNFIAIGGDARLAAERAGRAVTDRYSVIEKRDFEEFVKRIQSFTVEECVRNLQIPYYDAEGLVPALLMYMLFLEGTSAPRVIVPKVSIREGILLNISLGPDPVIQQEFHTQAVASASSIARKYHYDEHHAQHVAFLALSLFDGLTDEHGLDNHVRLLLEAAAILHDIGTYVQTSGHHKHGQYLVANSEIFGLHGEDIDVVSNVVRYHRKSLPQPSHASYTSLPREKRIVVLKLAAILRVADALDRGHSQRIKRFTMEKSEDELVLRCEYQGDISIERYGLSAKADMFEEVFGMRVVLL
jgi:exopolyphosphatase / guanosine-5'-triphosphate,3'-diphosphate pyrophosphatase